MPGTEDVIRVIGAVESLLPIVVGLVRELKGLVSGSVTKTPDDILAEADANWAQVIAAAKKELAQ